MKKKLMAWVLCAVMVVVMLPAPVAQANSANPVMTLTTARASGSNITLSLQAENESDLAGVWVDLNNNAVKDDGEATVGMDKTYVISSQTIKVYGKVTLLNCKDSEVTALAVRENPYLRSLNCSNNALTTLDCFNMDLTALDVTQNTALTSLGLYGNDLTALDVSQNTALITLNLSDNHVTALDVSHNVALKTLICSNNPVSSLSLSANTQLTNLQCAGCSLTALDVSAQTALTELNCRNNSIGTLDLTANTALINLYCTNNALTALTLPQSTTVKRVECEKNQLTELDVSHLTGVTVLNCAVNQLTALDMSQNTALMQLKVYSNAIKGAAMTALMNGLRTASPGYKLYIINTAASPADGNVALVSDVSIATDKNWTVLDWNGGNEQAYAGSEAPAPITFVLSNEEGGLIDNLIVAGYGDDSLYEALLALEPASGGVLSADFLNTLSACPAGSELFTQTLNSYAGLNGGVAINTDGTAFTTTSIKGQVYYWDTGYSTYPTRAARENFTYADSAAYYIDAPNGGTTYKVFAIGWSANIAPTFMLSNEEGGLIDKLIADGHGDDSLYEVLQILQPISNGAIPADYMAALAACPADCDAKTAELSNFSDVSNNPIGIGSNGHCIVAPIYGCDLDGDAGFSTTTGNIAGVGNVLFTSADSEADFIDAGAHTYDGVTHYYKAFAIAWMNTTATPPTVTTDTVNTSGITQNSAAVSGSVTSAGTASVTERGFVCGASANPTTATGTKVTAALGIGTGAFSATLSGLASSTAYHVRAYATSGAGTAYGEDRTFTTQSGGGGGGGGSTTQTYSADVKEGDVKTDTLPVTASGSTGTASLGAAKAAELFDAGNAYVVMPSIPGVSVYTLELPASAPDAGQKGSALTLSTGLGSVTIPDNMLGNLTGTDGKTAGITVAQGNTSGLTDAEKAAVGNHPLIQLTLTLDGKQTEWNNPAVPVTVTIPYAPTAAELENPECIIIWYLDGSGNLVCVPNGHYDAATGTVTLKTTHFSFFAGGYNKVTFNDVAENAWYGTAVDFIAARGITTGTGGGNYSPGAKLTRGEFLVMLMRTYGIAPVKNPTDNFADAGNTWYTNYLAAAKRLGISNGIGDNMFAPGKEITRQEMFTLLYNALNVIGQLPQEQKLPVGSSGKTLSDFSDADNIASWAKDAITLLVKTGTVSGSGGKLSPTDTTTRAEMAQVLYNLLMK